MKNEPTVKGIKINVDAVLKQGNLDTIVGQVKETSKQISEIFSDKAIGENIQNAFVKAKTELTKQETLFKGLTTKKESLQAALKYAQSPEEKKTLQDALKLIQKSLSQNKLYQKERNKAIKENLEKIKDIGKEVAEKLEKIYNGVKERRDEMASYNVSGSIFGTSKARQTMLQYGTSEAETYGLTKTMETLGLNEEDLWYMNPNQREAFAEIIGKYTSKYQELANKDFFKSYEEFKLEFTMFKEELYYDLIGVIVQNKDIIMSFFKVGVDAMKGIVSFLGKIGFGSQGNVRPVSDVMSSYINSSSNTTQSYNFTNTYNVNDTSLSSAELFNATIMNTIKQLTQS